MCIIRLERTGEEGAVACPWTAGFFRSTPMKKVPSTLNLAFPIFKLNNVPFSSSITLKPKVATLSDFLHVVDSIHTQI